MIKSLKLLFLLPIWILAQDYPIAPEIWSEPELIDEISDFFPNDEIVSVSVTGDGQKLFIHLADIAYLEKTDSGWSNPEFLNENINSGTVGWPCISPNGERLFFSRYSNGWNLYYSDWDSLMNDWGESKNCGPGINLSETVHCSIPNDSTIIFGREGQTYISMLDKINNIWSEGRGFPDDDNPYYSENGFFISSDFKKFYNDLPRTDTLTNSETYLHQDITVQYQSDFDPSFYWPPRRLNYCVNIADSLFSEGVYSGKYEGSPTLTEDGKSMYFMANYAGRALIYKSHLLINENGDTITNVNNKYFLSGGFELKQNYPNPFNPLTKIEYTVNYKSFVRLRIFDSVGIQIVQPINGIKEQGTYHYTFNSNEFGLSSGIYFYQLIVDKKYETRKMILLK